MLGVHAPQEQFVQETNVQGEEIVVLMEMTHEEPDVTEAASITRFSGSSGPCSDDG